MNVSMNVITFGRMETLTNNPVMDSYKTDRLSAIEAKERAQWIAFGPVVFQAARVLRDSGILEVIKQNKGGLTQEEVVAHVKLPRYGVRVLLEAALGIGLLTYDDRQYKITKTGYFILNDSLTRVNMDFIHDVCYQGMFSLDESIRNEKPEGLKVFGDWPTIYDALSSLPEPIKKSWFAFDHFYSDSAFPEILSNIFSKKVDKLMDIGGNTGKWTLQCLEYNKDVTVTIVDLPGQVSMAMKQIEEKGYKHRVNFYPCNILDEREKLPEGFDAIWMSQFLDCFSDDQIISILKRCREALSSTGYVYILEAFWDRQRFEASAFVLQQTSLYFTALANGNSQMYNSEIFIRLVEDAGLKVVQQRDDIGVSHTLLTCMKG